MADIISTFSLVFFAKALQKKKKGKKEKTNRVGREKERKTFVLHQYLTLAFSLALPKRTVNPERFH